MFFLWFLHQTTIISLLIFISPCIVIYSCSTTNKMHLLSQIIYSCKTLCMFRRSFVHHQELKTACTATVYVKQMLLPAAIGDEMELCSISSPAATGSSSCLTYTVAVYAVLSSWWWMERPPKHVEHFTRINNLRQQVHLVGCTIWTSKAVSILVKNIHWDQ